MSGTKIVVLQMKEIIRSVLFVLVALILIIALVALFMPDEKDAGSDNRAVYNAGTYSSQVFLGENPVDISVTVDDNSIIDIKISQMEEVQEVFYPLVEPTFETIAEEILRTQSLNVSVSTDNQFTTSVILGAVSMALENAKTVTESV